MAEFEYRGDTVWGRRWPSTYKSDGACSNCGKVRDKSAQHYCRSCRAAYMRAWRAKTNGKGE